MERLVKVHLIWGRDPLQRMANTSRTLSQTSAQTREAHRNVKRVLPGLGSVWVHGPSCAVRRCATYTVWSPKSLQRCPTSSRRPFPSCTCGRIRKNAGTCRLLSRGPRRTTTNADKCSNFVMFGRAGDLPTTGRICALVLWVHLSGTEKGCSAQRWFVFCPSEDPMTETTPRRVGSLQLWLQGGLRTARSGESRCVAQVGFSTGCRRWRPPMTGPTCHQPDMGPTTGMHNSHLGDAPSLLRRFWLRGRIYSSRLVGNHEIGSATKIGA